MGQDDHNWLWSHSPPVISRFPHHPNSKICVCTFSILTVTWFLSKLLLIHKPSHFFLAFLPSPLLLCSWSLTSRPWSSSPQLTLTTVLRSQGSPHTWDLQTYPEFISKDPSFLLGLPQHYPRGPSLSRAPSPCFCRPYLCPEAVGSHA